MRRLLGVPDFAATVSRRAGARAARSGDGAARDAAPASWRRWRPLRVSRGLPAGSRGPAGRPTAKDGGETGKSVCGPRPGTPVDAEVDLDVIWMPGGLRCRAGSSVALSESNDNDHFYRDRAEVEGYEARLRLDELSKRCRRCDGRAAVKLSQALARRKVRLVARRFRLPEAPAGRRRCRRRGRSH